MPTKKVLSFLFVGGIGFGIDAGILILLTGTYMLDIYLSRVASFFFATLGTWLLNRVLVFKRNVNPNYGKKKEYFRYISVQTLGGITNFIAFSLVIMKIPELKSHPIIPLSIGSFFGLFVNYTGSHFFVFNNKTTGL